MGKVSMKCPEMEELSFWCDSQSDAAITAHVNVCLDCQAWVSDVRQMEKALHSKLTSVESGQIDIESIMERSRHPGLDSNGLALVSSSVLLRIAALFIICGVTYLFLEHEPQQELERVELPDKPVEVITMGEIPSGAVVLNSVKSIDDSDLSKVSILHTESESGGDLELNLALEVSHVWAPNKSQTQEEALEFLLAILDEMDLSGTVQVGEVSKGVIELESHLLDADLLRLVKRLHEADLPLMSSQQPQPESIDDIVLRGQLIRYKIQLTK